MIQDKLIQHIQSALQVCYQIQVEQVLIEPTREGIAGDFTLVVFPYVKHSKKSPEQTAEEIGKAVADSMPEIASYNVIKGFLNFTLTHTYWSDFLKQANQQTAFGYYQGETRSKIWVEYSSPNTNKPLHLGHVRNNLLGYAIVQILKANGHEVRSCNLINDRGIHICKSMLAWQKLGNHETPETAGMKGDHLVGKYYVIFDQEYKKELKQLQESGLDEKAAESKSTWMQEAKEMLRKWESGDAEVLRVWKMMNEWVYAGFNSTYQKLGVSFDQFYYESETYLLGKSIVDEGLDKQVFFKKDDGSVWIDLTNDGLDQKLLLRSDGTSVYMTQDLGTAEKKYEHFQYNRSVYVVGNEQDYHFKVLQLICQKLNKPYAAGIYHLSYGMVELPHGKMKSREGTVVDADDLIEEMINTAEKTTIELGKTEGFDAQSLEQLYQTIGMGALKYFILKVDPKKKMLFNPAESIDFHGNTGPFIQYTYARIQSIMRNAKAEDLQSNDSANAFNSMEIELIKNIHAFPETIEESGREMSPAVLANYVYEVAKSFNHFYHECSILKEPDQQTRMMRIQLCKLTAHVIKTAFGLLGIAVPEKM
jgi:arginyl-tRNA synthetase